MKRIIVFAALVAANALALAGDWSKPLTTSTYTNFVTEIKDRDSDLALGFDPAVTAPTNYLTNTIRWSSAAAKWQKWNGTAWGDLASSYAISITGSAPTLTTPRTINGVSFNGSANISVNTVQAATFNNGGAGAASGTTFDGGTARTISYNTIGAPSTAGTGATGTWPISITGAAGSATTATTANALNTANTYTVAGFTTNRAYGKSNGPGLRIEAGDGSGTVSDNVALLLNDGSSGSQGGNSLIFRQTNSSSPRRYAGIWGLTDASGSGGSLVFGTINSDNDTTGPLERMRLNSVGNLNVSGTVTATTFAGNATTATAIANARQIFTSSGTWTKPTGVTAVFVEMWGGGGGGSGASGGAGGGGGYAAKWFSASALGATESVTVGAGGGAAAAGGNSSFGSFLTAYGGGGGQSGGMRGGGGGGGRGAGTGGALPNGGLGYSDADTGGSGGDAGTNFQTSSTFGGGGGAGYGQEGAGTGNSYYGGAGGDGGVSFYGGATNSGIPGGGATRIGSATGGRGEVRVTAF